MTEIIVFHNSAIFLSILVYILRNYTSFIFIECITNFNLLINYFSNLNYQFDTLSSNLYSSLFYEYRGYLFSFITDVILNMRKKLFQIVSLVEFEDNKKEEITFFATYMSVREKRLALQQIYPCILYIHTDTNVCAYIYTCARVHIYTYTYALIYLRETRALLQVL